MLWFLVITTLYIPVKYITYKPGENSLIYFAIYLLLIIGGEYFINLGITTAMCDNTQWGTAIMVTIVPWLVIFGVLNIMLKIFPGWLTPFSNTIGYAITKMMGVGDVFTKILATPGEGGENKEMDETLARIYSDESLMINEIPSDVTGFIQFWKRIRPLMKNDIQAASGDDNQIRAMLDYVKHEPDAKTGITPEQSYAYQLFSYVRLKNLVSEYVWYMLTGALVTSVGYNYILNAGCEVSAQQMQRRHDAYMDAEKEQAKARAAKPERVYKSTD